MYIDEQVLKDKPVIDGAKQPFFPSGHFMYIDQGFGFRLHPEQTGSSTIVSIPVFLNAYFVATGQLKRK